MCGKADLSVPRNDVRAKFPEACRTVPLPGFRINVQCTMDASHVPFVVLRLPGQRLPFLYHNGTKSVRQFQGLPKKLPLPFSAGHPLRTSTKVAAFDSFILQHRRCFPIVGTGLNKEQLANHLKKYHGLEQFGELVEYVHNPWDSSQKVHMNPGDLVMATIYYTAFFAAAMQKQLLNPNFIYFIQDVEPIFFPHNSEYMHALETYSLPHFPIFSTTFLQDYFVQQRLGLYACNPPGGELDWAAQPAIRRHMPLNLSAPPPAIRTLIVYARRHAERNAFEFTLSALSTAIQEGVFDKDQWRMIGVGSKSEEEVCGLGGRPDACLLIRPNVKEPLYLEMLANADVGLSLMVSPHPSLPPLDFAAAGMVVVTNAFATKGPASFANISRNVLVVRPTLRSIVAGLRKAVELSHDRALRKERSTLNWASTWDDDRCYGPTLFRRVEKWFTYRTRLDACLTGTA